MSIIEKTNALKEYALSLGFSKVGVTSVSGFEEYEEIVLSRGDSYSFLSGGARASVKIQELAPEAKSIIVLAYDYGQVDFPEALKEKVGRAYLARCYNPPENTIHHARAGLLENYLRGLGYTAFQQLFVPARWAAAKAGVATFGRNTFAYVDGSGSFVILYTIVVDAELAYDQPTMQCKCPPSCTACVDACPTKALSEPFQLIPQKCMAFQTFLSGARRNNGSTDYIPLEMREKLGQKVHGCDICQEACPRNRRRLNQKLPKDQFLEILSEDFSLRELLHLSDHFFLSRVQPIMYNYIRKHHVFQRNAAVAIGNTKDAGYLPDLAAEMAHPEAAVRAHVAWALGEIGGVEAAEILDKGLAVETEPQVKEELRMALDKCAVNMR